MTEGRSGVQASMYDVVKRVEKLEREVDRLKVLISFRSEALTRPTLVSFRGAARLLVSVDELERGIEEAKSTLFRREL